MNDLSQMKGFNQVSHKKISLAITHMKLKAPTHIQSRRKMADEHNFPFTIWDLKRLWKVWPYATGI